ncbi:c-type cytochrome biogenesis protein CcmI [Pseudomonas sp. J237]|nr:MULTISPECIES: c-type cytochrome biogenesis protein CcmI [Pseudomonas]OEO24167.1 c-type cytochrome biogenesis protein CcmI [Pseudomonas sp. J237]
MIEFWLLAGLLLVAALGFLLVPLVRGRKAQTEEDRTALNVTLYQERMAELEKQAAANVLTAEQLQAGKDEAARELLADTDGLQAKGTTVLGRQVPIIIALLVPLMGYGMYLHWGAIGDVERTVDMVENQPKSIEEMTARLENSLKEDPNSAEGWYFLGRTYMAQERASEAAKAFERSIELSSRDPALLGQWAQALYFASDKQWTEQLQSITDEALKADPEEATSLGLLGIAAFEEGRFDDAIGYWEKLVAVLPPEDPSRAAIQGGIERARAQINPDAQAPAVAGADQAGPETAGPQTAATDSAAKLNVKVSLAADLKDKVQPGDSVFVFARAVSGPPMPLAVKRMTVADLPAEVSLSDADAMMPMLKISGFKQVQLVARISRSGNAREGEWVGQSEPLNNDTAELQQLTINTADTQVQ